MFKLLFLIILFLNLEPGYSPTSTLLGYITKLPRLTRREKIKNSSPVVPNTPSTIKMPNRDRTQGLAMSVRYRPLIVEESPNGGFDPSLIIEDYSANPGSIPQNTTPKKEFFCPNGNAEKYACLLPTTEQLCVLEARPVIEPLFMEAEVVEEDADSADAGDEDEGQEGQSSSLIKRRCGLNGNGYMYGVFYQLCSKTNSKDEIEQKGQLETYTFCYDHTKKETIFAQYLVFMPRLLLEKQINEAEEIPFKMSTDDFGYFGKFFETVEASYANSKNSYKAEKLVSPDDMAPGVWKIPTFHFANTRPQHETLVGLWNKIGKMILTSSAAKRDDPHLIYVGAYKLSKDDEHNEFVYEKNILIPEIWIKVVIITDDQHVERGLAILMNNFPNDSTLKWKSLCVRNFCDIPNRKDEVFVDFADIGGNVRCCPLTEEILKFFNLEEQFDAQEVGILEIDDLTEQELIINYTKGK